MTTKPQIFNIFPTTIYVGEVENHDKHKTDFLKLYDKFDYEENEISSTVSELLLVLDINKLYQTKHLII